MKIAESSIQMGAKWSSVNRLSVRESLRTWNDAEGSSTSTNDNVLIDISNKGKELLKSAQVGETQSTEEESDLLTEEDREKIALVEHFIRILTGKRLRFMLPRKIKLNPDRMKELQLVEASKPISVTPVRQGWGIDYSRYERVEEHERLSFASSGTVTTADGRQIQFNLNFLVSRDFISETHTSIKAGDALLDPLVINFRNGSASLGDRSYAFDLDMDGVKDNIAFTAEGSGFLALDKNGNGEIDDGSELFGPSSGNGFGELATYDLDSNGWIDENDPIYDKLRIWSLDGEGYKQLIALGQAGVGAIYLGHVTTPFSLKNGANDSLGQIQSSGVFLFENGTAGTIQHVDLTI